MQRTKKKKRKRRRRSRSGEDSWIVRNPVCWTESDSHGNHRASVALAPHQKAMQQEVAAAAAGGGEEKGEPAEQRGRREGKQVHLSHAGILI